MPHALPLYCTESVRAIERAAGAHGLDASVLMARAGAAVAALAVERWPQVRSVGVLCGPGNNGGDGYVAALALLRAGLDVAVIHAGEPRTSEARAAARAWADAGKGVITAGAALPRFGLLIDALFGVGLRHAPEGVLAETLRVIAALRLPVLSIDVPSGIDADSGSAFGAAFRADVTLCLLAAKRGLFTAAGRESAGEIRIDGLGVPREAFARIVPNALGIAVPALRTALPVREIDSHKARHGRVLCIGGEVGMEGALVLSAEAAARAGAGSVVAWTRAGAVAALHARRPEVMALAVHAGAAAGAGLRVDAAAIRRVSANVISLGSGLGQNPWGRELFELALATDLPLVLDADALNWLAINARPLPRAVLTPHPGEAARLLGLPVAAVQADRFAALVALVERFECAVVLKGAGTLIGAPGERPRVLLAGNPGMASAGMGDVLAGVIAALVAQGLPPFEAAWVGALAHSAAGDQAAAGQPRGLLAGDLLDTLRQVLNP